MKRSILFEILKEKHLLSSHSLRNVILSPLSLFVNTIHFFVPDFNKLPYSLRSQEDKQAKKENVSAVEQGCHASHSQTYYMTISKLETKLPGIQMNPKIWRSVFRSQLYSDPLCTFATKKRNMTQSFLKIQNISQN